MRLRFGQIRAVFVVVGSSFGARLSFTNSLSVTLLFLLCKEVLPLDLQIEVFRHIRDDVGDHPCDHCYEPLENENKGQPGSEVNPIFLLVIVREIGLVVSRISENQEELHTFHHRSKVKLFHVTTHRFPASTIPDFRLERCRKGSREEDHWSLRRRVLESNRRKTYQHQYISI